MKVELPNLGIQSKVQDYTITKSFDDFGVVTEIDSKAKFDSENGFETLLEETFAGNTEEDCLLIIECGDDDIEIDALIQHNEGSINFNNCYVEKSIKFKSPIECIKNKDINIFDNVGGSFRTYNIKKKNTNLQHLRYKKKVSYQFNTHINIVISQHLNLIVQNYSYEYHPYRKFLVCKTLDNTLHYLPGIEHINVGSCIYSHTNKSLFNITNLLRGFVSEVRKLPINTLVSNLNNYSNSKNTFAKSAGTYCKLKKTKKTKKKLALLELPSGQETLLPQTTICFVGKNQNFQKTSLVEGS